MRGRSEPGITWTSTLSHLQWPALGSSVGCSDRWLQYQLRDVCRAQLSLLHAGRAALATYASVIVGSPGHYSVVLYVFVFLWFLLYPIQMGIFSELDASGRLAMIAYLAQLIAFSIGPAWGGLILRSDSYKAFGLCCGLGYLAFVCAALTLLPATNKSVQPASEIC